MKDYQPFDLERIREKMNISEKSINNCPISVEELEKIYYDYIDYIKILERLRLEILSILNRGVTGEVHSIRSRVKQPDHLIAKIIRGVYRNPARYHAINVETYRKIITDLVGIRIIILDRRDWKEVHQDLLQIFRNIPERYARRPMDIMSFYDRYADESGNRKNALATSYHAERPVVYIASEGDRKLYHDPYLRVDTSKSNYRSIHYIIRYGGLYFEIQMRSLFEEGWLEFDHRMKYPNDQYNRRKQEYISILSNLANAADQLISYYEEEDFTRYTENKEDDDRYASFKRNMNEEKTVEDKLRSMF